MPTKYDPQPDTLESMDESQKSEREPGASGPAPAQPDPPIEPGTALEQISIAQQALGEAKTLPDIKAVHDWAETLRAGARARRMGIEAENGAAEIVVRAERKMGEELLRMKLFGERDPGGRGGLADRGSVNLQTLGIPDQQSSRWQRLARLSDEEFDYEIARAREQDEGIARVNFYRLARALGLGGIPKGGGATPVHTLFDPASVGRDVINTDNAKYLAALARYVRHISAVAVPRRTNPAYVRRRAVLVEALLRALDNWAYSTRVLIEGLAEESDQGSDSERPVRKFGSRGATARRRSRPGAGQFT